MKKQQNIYKKCLLSNFSLALRLDLKDERILYELDKNARLSSSAIAKEVGLTPEGVAYKIKRFEEEGIITNYQVVVNLAKLGLFHFKIFLSFAHLPSEKLSEIITRLKAIEDVKWIVACRGNWDMIITIFTTDVTKADAIKLNVLDIFGKHIRKKSFSILVAAETYNRNYLVEGKNIINSRAVMKQDGRATIDDLDLRLLKTLTKNSRQSLVTLARELETTPRIISYRIKQLEKKKLILGYKMAIDYKKTGIKFHKCLVYLAAANAKRRADLVQYFLMHPNIIHNVQVISDWDYEPEFETSTEEEFENILAEMNDRFSDVISFIDVLTISQEHKFVYF